MLCIYDSNGSSCGFDTIEELKEYIESRHAEEGGFDWISEIKDSTGDFYGCTWTLEIEKI
jgi:hypothetical protein